MGQVGVRPTFLLFFHQPGDTQGGKGCLGYLSALQLSDLVKVCVKSSP